MPDQLTVARTHIDPAGQYREANHDPCVVTWHTGHDASAFQLRSGYPPIAARRV